MNYRIVVAITLLLACSRTTTTTRGGTSGASGAGGSSGTSGAAGAGGTKVCEPDAERECNCQDGSISTRFCLHSGLDWSDCDCYLAGAAGSNGSAGVSGAAGAGGSGATGGGGVGGTGGASGTSGTAGAAATGATCGDGPKQPISEPTQSSQINGPNDLAAGNAESLCDASCGFPQWAFTVYPDGTAPQGCVVRDFGSNIACCPESACGRYATDCVANGAHFPNGETCILGAVESAGCELSFTNDGYGFYCCP